MFDGEYRFSGKHAQYAKYLAGSSGLYENNLDVYMSGAVFGLLYNRYSPKDSSTDDDAHVGTFSARRSECVFLYRLVMLLERQTDLTMEEKVDRAFKDDADEARAEKMKANMELFHGYVRGGVEVMYERFIMGGRTPDDYLEKALDEMDSFCGECPNNPSDFDIDNYLR